MQIAEISVGKSVRWRGVNYTRCANKVPGFVGQLCARKGLVDMGLEGKEGQLIRNQTQSPKMANSAEGQCWCMMHWEPGVPEGVVDLIEKEAIDFERRASQQRNRGDGLSRKHPLD